MYINGMPYIFASYSNFDSAVILPIIDALSAKGFNIWHMNDIQTGSDDPEIIAEKLINCSIVLTFVSENAVNSPTFKQELRYAITKDKSILCIYLSDIQLSPGLEMQLAPHPSLFRYKFGNDADFTEALSKSKLIQDCMLTEAPAVSTPITENSFTAAAPSFSPVAENRFQAPATASAENSASQANVNSEEESFDANDLTAKISFKEPIHQTNSFTAQNFEKPVSVAAAPANYSANSYAPVYTPPTAPVATAITYSNSRFDLGPALWEYVKNITDRKNSIIKFRNALSEKTLQNATAFIANNEIKPYWVIALVGWANFEGKEGIVFTRDKLFVRSELMQFSFRYTELTDMEQINPSSICFTFADRSIKAAAFSVKTDEIYKLLSILIRHIKGQASNDGSYIWQISKHGDSALPEAEFNIENVLWEYYRKLGNPYLSKFILKNALKPKSLSNVAEYITNCEMSEYNIIAILDETVFESGKEGVAFTKEKIYTYTKKKHYSFKYTEILDVKLNSNNITVSLSNGSVLNIYCALIDLPFYDILKLIIKQTGAKGYQSKAPVVSRPTPVAKKAAPAVAPKAAPKKRSLFGNWPSVKVTYVSEIIEDAIKHANSSIGDSRIRFNHIATANEKQKRNLLECCAPGIKPEELIAFMDTSTFASGKEGFIMTKKALFDSTPKNKPIYLTYVIAYEENGNNLTIIYENGKRITNTYLPLYMGLLTEFLRYIAANRS